MVFLRVFVLKKEPEASWSLALKHRPKTISNLDHNCLHAMWKPNEMK